MAHQHERKIGVRAGGDFIEIPRDEFAFHGQIFAVDHVEILFLSQPFDKGAPAVVGLQENRGGSLGEFDAVGHGGFEGGHHAQIFRVFHENGAASGSQRAVGGDARHCLEPEVRKELLQVRDHVPVGGIGECVAERRVGTILPFEEFVADALRVAQDLICRGTC